MMIRTLTLSLTLSLPAMAGACADDVAELQPAALDSHSQAVVYGADNRIEVEDASAAAQAAANSVAGLFWRGDVTPFGSDSYQIATPTTLGESRQLCEGQSFADQPDSAWCTGFQVGPKLIATAGHCITSQSDCDDVTFAFNYKMANGEPQTILPEGDIYDCTAIVDRNYGDADWAIVEVDRDITGRLPLAVRETGSVQLGEKLSVIGHPSGLPAKVAAGAEVKGNSAPEYFEANLDSFGGNSGSPVFNETLNLVEGILVRGQADYVKVGKGKRGCYEVNTCPDSGCAGGVEQITRATEFAFILNAEPPPPCPDDSLEPNGGTDDATVISGGDDATGLQLCATDEDWFEVWVLEGQVLTATIDFTHADGDLNLELRDVLGGVMDASSGSGNSETVTSKARSFSGTLYVVVTGAGLAQNGYDLTTTVSTPPPPTGGSCGDGTCDEGESCDGRSGTTSCSSDCPGRTGGKPARRWCTVGGSCEGPGC